MQSSLRIRLLILILLPLTIVSSLAVYWRFTAAKDIAEEVFDRNLIMLTIAISRDVTLSEGDSLSETTSNLFRSASGGAVFYHVYGPDGRFTTGYSSPPVESQKTIIKENSPIVFNATHLGVPVRVAKLVERTSLEGVSGNSVVTAWQRLDLRQSFARDLALRAGALAGLLVLTVAALVLFGVKLGLKPLNELEQAIQKRSSGDLSPIVRKVPKETRGIVSRLNALFDQVTQVRRARDRFISNAAHQLRNPIAGILSLAQATLGADTLQESKRRAGELVAETRRTSRLTEQLLSLERLDGRAPQFQQLDIGAVITKVGERNAAKILNADIEFSVSIPKGLLKGALISGDQLMLSEAIQNLLDNAVLHGGKKLSYIAISALVERDNVVVTVENDGTVISPAVVDDIFERFTQGNGQGDGHGNEQGDESEGSGLGLAIVAEIMRLHGGNISIETKPATKFSMTLPLAQNIKA